MSITGNYIDCNDPTNGNGIVVYSSDGYSISGNQIHQCGAAAIIGGAHSGPQGADNGFVGPNALDPGAKVNEVGSRNTVTSSLSIKSSNYILAGSDSLIYVTGNTTIAIPPGLVARQWTVFNSGTGNVSLICGSGTIYCQTSLSLAPKTGKTATTDGKSCFAF